jgi:hypothetical protein
MKEEFSEAGFIHQYPSFEIIGGKYFLTPFW